MNPTKPKENAALLESQFRQLEHNPFWHQYLGNLQERYEQALSLALSKADAPEAELRVAVAIASAFRTALNLPAAIINAARVQEDIDNMENRDADPADQ